MKLLKFCRGNFSRLLFLALRVKMSVCGLRYGQVGFVIEQFSNIADGIANGSLIRPNQNSPCRNCCYMKFEIPGKSFLSFFFSI